MAFEPWVVASFVVVAVAVVADCLVAFEPWVAVVAVHNAWATMVHTSEM